MFWGLGVELFYQGKIKVRENNLHADLKQGVLSVINFLGSDLELDSILLKLSS